MPNLLKRNRGRRGGAMIEMTLVGIPIIFAVISIFELSRGMWAYQTLAYSMKEGTRFAAVHGTDNPTTVGAVATVIQNAAVGLNSGSLQITMSAVGCTDVSGTLTSLVANATTYPCAIGSNPQSTVTMSATYPFRSAIAMFWPGAGTGQVFGTFTFPASAQETIQF